MTDSTDPNVAAQHVRAAAERSDDARTRELRERVAPKLTSLELGECLGRGGTGVVFRARQLDLGTDVAVKVIAPPPESRSAWSARFQREARALSELDHPGIVAIHGFGEDDDLAWIVMELVDGASLRELMDAGTLTPEEALAIAPELCAALEYAHELGIVHRDVKPGNVLVDASGRVKLVDFGIAKLAGDEASTRLTHTHQAMGTLRYMAPEQLDAPQSVDHRADIYALGILLYEMLTGVVPQGVIAPPSKRVSVDVRLDEVVLRSLEREPEQRYQRVAELAKRVESIRGQRGPASDIAPTPEEIRAEYRAGLRNDFALVVGFVAVTALLGTEFAKELGRPTPIVTLAAVYVVLLSLPIAFALFRGPSLWPIPTGTVRLVTPFLMFGASMIWGRMVAPFAFDFERHSNGAILLGLTSKAFYFFMLAPFLTAAAGTHVARQPMWGPAAQGAIRWLGVALCAFAVAASSPSGRGTYSWDHLAFLGVFLVVGIYAAFPRDRGRSSLGHHRRAIAFAAAAILGRLVVDFPGVFPASSESMQDRNAASNAALALAILGGLAGIGSPRDAPDPPQRRTR
ncbi:MAG: serine/threonine-protein kinase [Planctomycetota bacterium]